MNGYRKRGYYDRENLIVNLGCYIVPHLLVSSFVQKDDSG